MPYGRWVLHLKLEPKQPHTTTFSAEQVIREFASDLVEGLSDEVVRAGLYELILHKVNKEVTDVAEVSIRNVTLFFEVFEIASRERGPLMIRDEKKWLLKAAFKPLGKVIEDNDSAIPF